MFDGILKYASADSLKYNMAKIVTSVTYLSPMVHFYTPKPKVF